MDPNSACDPDSGIFGLDVAPEDAVLQLIPVPWDATTSYRDGAHRGPPAILRASHQLDMQDRALGVPYIDGICMQGGAEELLALNHECRAAAERVIAAAGRPGGLRPELVESLAAVNRGSQRVNTWVYERACAALDAGAAVGVVGGDHASPFGLIRALAERNPGMGILHVDAHADLRREYEGFEHSHASIMDNALRRIDGVARLVQVGIRDFCEEERQRIVGAEGRIVTFYDLDLAERRFAGETWAALTAEIVASLPARVYVSFDIDGLSPDLCPGTGTPVPGGLSFHEATHLIAAVARSGRTIVGFDLCEVSPSRVDPEDEWDANVGARILFKLCGWTLRSQGRI
ncbi:MAG: arginase family protein [Nannocystis sp.]|nr:arginase family protein [Nannocystis sp.]